MDAGLSRKSVTPSAGQRLRQVFAWIAGRLRNRPDSEHEMTVNRLALSGVAFSYLIIATLFGRIDADHPRN